MCGIMVLSEIKLSQRDKYCMIPNNRFLMVINMVLYKIETFNKTQYAI